MFKEVSYLQLLSNVLSVITILTCFILKVPQIINILKLKSANGVSLQSLLMELSSYTVMMSYNFRNGHALLSFMEYPIILVQQLILVASVMYYKKCININGLFGCVCYFGFAIGLFFIVPKGILTFLVPICTPVGASAKVVQLIEIIRTKNSKSVSLLTWFISAFTNLTRVFTTYVDSSDAALLLNFFINTFLSSSIMLAAYLCKPSRAKKGN